MLTLPLTLTLTHISPHQEADRGRSGELGMSEFVAALGGLWPHMSRKGLQRLFMQVDANSDGTVTWEELVTFLLLKDQVIDDAAHNKYLPPAGSASNQKGLPPAELHTAAITQLLHAPAMFKDKYLTLSKDNTLKLWRTRTLQHMRTVQLGEG